MAETHDFSCVGFGRIAEPDDSAQAGMTASASSPSSQLQLCGEPAYVSAEGQRIGIEAKDALLLAYLAIEGATPRAHLAALAWPQVDRERARSNLRQRLFRLRKLLGIELLREGEVTALRADLPTDLQAVDGDADVQFTPLLGSFEWRGGGEMGAWLVAARARHIEARIDALARQCSDLEAQGRLVAALQQAQRLVAVQPISEHAHRRLMRLHHLRGDRAAALAAYERCVQILDDELGTAPSTETRALARQIDGQPDSPAGKAKAVPASVLRPPQLIGRQPQWAALQAAWAAHARVIVLGEAGMGKTRLISDFAAAQAGVLVITARPGDARAPYALLSRLLQGLLPALQTPLAPGETQELARLLPALGSPPAAGADTHAAQARFLQAVQALLRGASRSDTSAGVRGIVLDDLHFADVASVEAVQSLMSTDVPLQWILASRPVELPAQTQALCDELLHGQAVEIRLAPLDQAQVGELVASLAIDGLDAAALAPRLARHTGGNPMFLLETLKAMVMQPQAGPLVGIARLPAVGTVTDVISRRMTRLSADAVRLARCAAITGQDFSSELASQVLGVRPLDLADAWNELEAAQVFRGGAFAHDLIYEAALASVPEPIAVLLHGQIARYLEARGDAPARVAQHWLDAGDKAGGAEALLLAAKQAGQLLRLREQADLLERAAGVLRELGQRRRCYEVLLELQLLVNMLGVADQRELVFEALIATADSATERYRAIAQYIDMATNLGRWDEALVLARNAVQEAAALDAEPHLTAQLRTKLAFVLQMTGRMIEAEVEYKLAEPRMQVHPDISARLGFTGEFASFLDNVGRHREARTYHQTCIDGARASNSLDILCGATANLGISFWDSGLCHRAAETLEETVRLRQVHDLAFTGVALLTLGQIQRSLGRYAAAIQNTESQRTLWQGNRDLLVCLCDQSLAMNYLHLGQPARAQQELRASVVSKDLPAGLRAKFLLVQARLAAAIRQDPTPMLTSAESLVNNGCKRNSAWRQVHLELTLCCAPEDALIRALEVLAETQRNEEFGGQISAHTRCAAIALKLQDTALAVSHAQKALDLLAEYDPDDLYRAEVGWVAWQALSAAGEPHARAVLEQTVNWVKETARLHVPEAFRESFLSRNPINRNLLNAVRKQI